MNRFAQFAAALALGLGIGAAPVLAQATDAEKITFLTNYVFNGRHAPFFVGVEKGFYKEAGFDVEIVPATGSGFVVAAIEGGQAQFGMADFSTVVQGVAKGARVKAFNVYTDISTSGLASTKPFEKPEALIGKTVAAGQTNDARVILPIILKEHSLDPEGIKWQAADPSVYFPLLLSGQVDLITATSDGDIPALTKIAVPQGKEVHFSSYADWGYDVFGYVLVGPQKAIDADPARAARFAAATRKAVEYSAAHVHEAAQIMVKYNPTMSTDTVETQLTGTLKAMNTPYTEKNGYGVATENRLAHAIELVQTALKLSAQLSPSDIFAQVGK